MAFADLSYAEQIYDLRGVLPSILAKLHSPAPTSVVAAKVARTLGCEPSMASALLMRVAHEYGATHDGDVIRRYGKRMQRWRWHPTSSASPAEPMPRGRIDLEEAYKPAEPLEHANLSLEEVGRLADCKTCGGTFLAVDIVNGKCTDCEDWSVAKED